MHSSKKRPTIIETVKSLFRLIKEPNVLRIINTSALHTAYLKAIKDYIQPLKVSVPILLPFLSNYVGDKKNGLIIGILYFILYLLTSLASQYSSSIANKIKKRVSYLSLLFGFTFGILSGVFYIFDLWILALLAFVGIYLIENIRKPILTGHISDEVPNEILTSVLSAQSLWRTIITSVLALSFGVLADRFGIGVGLGVVSLLLLGVGVGFRLRKQN
jgi:uncharacterized membrane protein YfcA